MLTRIMSSRSWSVTSDGSREMPWPTLLIQTSMCPKRAIASLTTRWTSSRTVASATMASTSVPHVAATASSTSLRRATITSECPCWHRRRAAASPMPVLAPVMTMTFPANAVDLSDSRWVPSPSRARWRCPRRRPRAPRHGCRRRRRPGGPARCRRDRGSRSAAPAAAPTACPSRKV